MQNKKDTRYLVTMTIAALGVVYGDIGTSPLYALRECFFGPHAVAVNHDNVLGVLSLVFWSLIVVISVKYISYVMRADNNGEGGVLALMALAHPKLNIFGRDSKKFLILIGLFGAALLYGDGMITPAISVLGAVEGLEVATPIFKPYVVPIAMVVLVILFMPQSFGTNKVGSAFGPIILIWFFTIAALGIKSIINNPHVFLAVNPFFAVQFFSQNGWHGFLILGVVFLVVTGGEALYADMGHFGRKPIKIGWLYVVLPALLLNYFGQGALLLSTPDAAVNPFFRLAPSWFLYPLIIIATFAAIIASQALISGTYSITRQAIQLGYLPRMQIHHTSEDEIGQIYMPLINWSLLISTLMLVLFFKSSSNLAAAYGVAVTATMVITTMLIFFVAHNKWRWSLLTVLTVTIFFVAIDFSFFVANVVKLFDGGWFPLAVGASIFTAMTTWRRGRMILAQRLKERIIPLEQFMISLEKEKPVFVDGTAVFMTSIPDGTPPSFVHNVAHNKVIHKNVILLTVTTENIPHVPLVDRYQVKKLGKGIFSMSIAYGFMDTPNIPAVLARAQTDELSFKLSEVTYFLGRETLLATHRPGMAMWRERLFSFMTKNAQRATAFYRLPTEQVFEIGIQVEL